MRKPISFTTAVLWMLDVLEGLAACHEQAIIHRDLKPENILLTRAERAKVGDLGVAQAFRQRTEHLPLPCCQVQERVDGKMLIVCQGKVLRYRQITEQPEIKKNPKVCKRRQTYVPPKDHPWRKFDIARYKRKAPQTAAA
jgi:serine/threonine protein kinase